MITHCLGSGWVKWGLMTIVLVALTGCSKSEEPTSTSSGTSPASRSVPAEKSVEQKPEPPQSVPPETPVAPERARTTAVPSSGTVLAGRDLGMVISGKGAAEPERSLEV